MFTLGQPLKFFLKSLIDTQREEIKGKHVKCSVKTREDRRGVGGTK